MRIKRLSLLDFGQFHQKEFTLAPGLNIATGANESGKTTLRRFVRSMLYGLERERGIKARKDDYTRYKPWNYGRFQGFLEFEAKGKTYRLFRNFLTAEKAVVLTELSTGQEISNPAEFLREQGLKSEAVYINTFWVGNACVTEELLGTELKEYLVNLAYGGGNGLNLQKSLARLTAQKKELLKQVRSGEISDCMEVLLGEASLQEQVLESRRIVEGKLQRQRELEGAIKAERVLLEQVTKERKQAEEEERKKSKGEWLLVLLCILAAVFLGIAFFFSVWKLKAVCLGLAIAACAMGVFLGLPLIKQGRMAGEHKEELEQQMLGSSRQLEEQYEELTRLLPEVEQEKLWMEQKEEQLKQCEIVKERYEELIRQQQILQREAEAVALAEETLEQLSVELYEEFEAKFATALSGYAKAFTDHAYDTLTADEELNLRAITDERSLEVSDVSFGTGEQLYLALRFAAADVFDPEKKNMVILDDSFAAFDDQRLESAILALEKCGRQILLLSSTGREETAAKRMGITYEKIF